MKAESFLGEDSGSVWGGFVMAWSRLFVGDPDEIPTDSGSCFTSDLCKKSCASHPISLRHINTESHNSLGEGATYNKTIIKVFHKLRLDSTTVPRALLLQLAVYAANIAVNAHGHITMLPVYGMIPRIPGVNGNDAIPQDEQFKVLVSARKEYARNVA